MLDSRIASLLDGASKKERAAEWPAALSLYGRAYDFCVAQRDSDGLLEVIIRTGFCCREAEQSELALDLLNLALTLGELHGNVTLVGRALNGIAILQQNAGDIDGAEQTYLQAREVALRHKNERLLGQVEQNLGILDNIRGDLEAALEHYLEGLKHLENAGHQVGISRTLNNLGMLHTDLKRLDEADRYFEKALEVCRRFDDVVMLATVHINRAELYLAQGDLDRARESCDDGFEIFSRLNQDSRKAEALKFYGIIYRESGKYHLAEIHLRQAIDIAVDCDPLLEAEAQRELGLTLRAQDRNREALAALNRSHTLFRGLQAQRDHADVDRRISKLESDFLSLVRTWGESIEAKDRYTSGHCERVATYACRIAQEIGMEEWEITWFRMGAFLHDVGKTEVPSEILNKPGKLTDEERALMERHTVIGDEMLAEIEFPWDIRPVVRSHHERWDGRGYPDRLAGEAIPFPARILRLADIFDALTTTRSYREPLTPETAFQIMEDDEGGFDPDLFEVFRALFPELAEVARAAGSTRAEVEAVH